MDGTTDQPDRGDHGEPGPLDSLDATILGEVRSLWGRLDPVPAGLAERA